MDRIEILNIAITPLKIDMPELLNEIYGISTLPITRTETIIEIKGIHIPEINALRRVLTDEIQHYHLTTNDSTIETDDPFISLSRIEKYISNIPICYSVSKEIIKKLKLGIKFKNKTTSNVVILCGDLVIQSSDAVLNSPIFDPTFELFSLSPGKSITITNIHLVTKYGKEFAGANLACNASYRFLDIEEYSIEEINKKENRIKPFVNQSGYKVSSFIANPIHHELSFTIPATSKNFVKEIHQILNDVCDNIIYRLRSILMHVENSSKGDSTQLLLDDNSIQSSILENSSNSTDTETINKYICVIPGETHTIGNLLKWYINDLFPQCSSVTYIINEKKLEITIFFINSEDVHKYMHDSIKHGIHIFKEIKKQFEKN
jgi:DNA-directed RNA polymerase subunit L